MNSFVIADSRQCIGCRTCEIACALAHDDGNISGNAFAPRLTVVKTAQITLPVLCRQCENAACANVCPAGAIRYGADSVEIRASLCIGCKACSLACPFGVIGLRDIPLSNGGGHRFAAYKCDICSERDQGPACVEVCPTGALKLMRPQELSQIQRQRQQSAAAGSRPGRQF
ncbi:4Fe-4S dicluster domain-containing protein [Martelella alba]|uniref:4Fe-4S dicluster domain-containing protein n=1 Tax=Martelella alba TaxID=2590451 RepID=A0ABY2SMQ4_9HYPH|nr:4Fe-4S dicluster domain-containing protein [Martelella alba]TKI07170.1 4Fe-4S dicluster domain-containing protein [Martelella alba]